METVFKKSFKEFYAFIILVLLSLLTIAADYRYNQLNYVRSLINDTVIYPIDYLSTMPKQILEASVEESQIKSDNLVISKTFPNFKSFTLSSPKVILFFTVSLNKTVSCGT